MSAMKLNYPGLDCLCTPLAYIEIDGSKRYLTYSILQWIVDRAEFCGNMTTLFEILHHFNVRNSKGNELNYTYFYKWKCNKVLNFHNRQYGKLNSPSKMIQYNRHYSDFIRDWDFIFYAYVKANCPSSPVI